MVQWNTLSICIALFGLISHMGCEAVVGEYEAEPCSAVFEEGSSCSLLGNKEAQQMGCCGEDAKIVYFCADQDAGIGVQPCLDGQTCDYDPNAEFMSCVE